VEGNYLADVRSGSSVPGVYLPPQQVSQVKQQAPVPIPFTGPVNFHLPDYTTAPALNTLPVPEDLAEREAIGGAGLGFAEAASAVTGLGSLGTALWNAPKALRLAQAAQAAIKSVKTEAETAKLARFFGRDQWNLRKELGMRSPGKNKMRAMRKEVKDIESEFRANQNDPFRKELEDIASEMSDQGLRAPSQMTQQIRDNTKVFSEEMADWMFRVPKKP
jgi:hypothetical protein